MSPKKSTAAWPILSLVAAMVLFVVSYVRGFPDWSALVILGAWWVGFAMWGIYFYHPK
jgi:hypothetical protein